MGKFLVTGASGFLGRYIVPALKQSGHEVKTIGRAPSNDIKCDLSRQIPALDEPVAWVIHAMGKAHVVPSTQEEAEEFYRVNVQGTQNLCLALEQQNPGIQGMVFISSVSVYGLDEGEGIQEDAPLKGSTPYALSKIEAEKWLTAWCIKLNIPLTILRLPLIAGEKAPGNLGAMQEAIQKGKYFNIGGGKARKSMVMATDVAGIIPTVAKKGGIFNLTDGLHPTFGELAKKLAANAGKKEPLNIPFWLAWLAAQAGNMIGNRFPLNSDRLKKITATLTFDDTRARASLAWKPQSVVEAI